MVLRQSQGSASRRLKILFTFTHHTTFIDEDLELLAKNFTVSPYRTRGVLSLISLPWRVHSNDVTFTWFASVYSAFVVFFARIFGKPSVIVIGGVDVAKIPEIKYGIWLSWWRSHFVRYAIRNAHRVLAVDPFQQREATRLAAYDGANIEYVPTGYMADQWRPDGTKEPFVLTVAACHDEMRMKKKGLDILFAAARKCPDTQFVIVGIAEKLLPRARESAPHNVEIVPPAAQERLLEYYRRAKVYCQPSYTEGLPNSLCEAMLCECIPVGTNVGGIPTAIRDIGLLVPYGDVEALSGAIRKALAMPHSVGQAARSYIAETFPLTRREHSLVRILHTLVR